jgi:hypothetical protein
MVESDDQDPFALLKGDLAETSALLHDCAAIARNTDNHLGNRLPAMTAAAQLARASAQIAKLLAAAPKPQPVFEISRTSSHPGLQRVLDRYHAEEDAKNSNTTAVAENP